MLSWGWFGWVPAMLVGYVAGSFVYYGVGAAIERRPVLDGLKRAVSVGPGGSSFRERLGKFFAIAFLVILVFYALLGAFSA